MIDPQTNNLDKKSTTNTTARIMYNDHYLNLQMQKLYQDLETLSKTTLSTGMKANHHHQHPPWLNEEPKEKDCIKSRVIINKRKRETLNPALISIAILSYILFNHLLASDFSISKNIAIKSKVFTGSSIVTLAAANPAPEPAQIRARSAASGSHRGPPINGSIFGKRSVNTITNGKSSRYSEVYSETDLVEQTPFIDKSEAVNYKDIITQVIENFLALNNESDTDKASVAFCRMIIYECTQMLSARSKSSRGGK